MSMASYFNKVLKDAPLPISWKPSTEPPVKKTNRASGWPRRTSDSPQTVMITDSDRHFVLEHHYCKSVMFVSWFSYRCCIFSYMRRSYSLIHVVSSDDPRHWKGTWDCCCGCRCHLSLPTMTWPYCECALALYIQATMPVHYWSQLIHVTQQ